MEMKKKDEKNEQLTKELSQASEQQQKLKKVDKKKSEMTTSSNEVKL